MLLLFTWWNSIHFLNHILLYDFAMLNLGIVLLPLIYLHPGEHITQILLADMVALKDDTQTDLSAGWFWESPAHQPTFHYK